MARIGSVIRDVYRRPGTEGLAPHLHERYGVVVTGLGRLDVGVFRVELEHGESWVARAMLLSRPVERTCGDAEVLAVLAAHGIPAERLATNEAVSVLEGRAVLVTRFLEGRRLQDTPSCRRVLGGILGRLATLEAGGAAVAREAGSLHHLPPFEGVRGGDLLAAEALLNDVAYRIPERHKEIHGRLRGLLERGDTCEGLPRGVIHPDPVLKNVLSTSDGPVLIDWSGAGTGPRLLSLAALLGSVAPAGAAEVIAGYREHVALQEDELERLEGALWVRPLWLACWQCWLAAVSSRTDRTFLPSSERIRATAEAARTAARQSLRRG